MKSAALSMGILAAALLTATIFPAATSAQEFRFQFDPEHFRFDREDRRGNEGKRASCTYYAQIAVVQAETNRRFNCGYVGPAWNSDARAHFQWCRFVRRETTGNANRERAIELQRCFDRMGDFDEVR